MLDLDFLAGFDWLHMEWTYSVLEKKNCNTAVISRLKNIYGESKSMFLFLLYYNLHLAGRMSGVIKQRVNDSLQNYVLFTLLKFWC